MALMGQTGFLQFFDAQLLGARRELILTPGQTHAMLCKLTTKDDLFQEGNIEGGGVTFVLDALLAGVAFEESALSTWKLFPYHGVW